MGLALQLLLFCGRSRTSSFTHCREGLSILIHWAGWLLLFPSSSLLSLLIKRLEQTVLWVACWQQSVWHQSSSLLLPFTDRSRVLSLWIQELFSLPSPVAGAHSSLTAMLTCCPEGASLLAVSSLRRQSNLWSHGRNTRKYVGGSVKYSSAWTGTQGAHKLFLEIKGKSSQQFFHTEEQVWLFKQICGHWCLEDPEALGDSQILIAR